MKVFELNLDGLVGPTHHFGGLALGNIASQANALKRANPQAAARQSLAKMGLLHSMGLKQGLLIPHQRPNLELLYQLGFKGSPQNQIAKAHQNAPELLRICYSASSMWAANTATLAASIDTEDNKVHFTAANLLSNLHRQQEAVFSKQILEKIFANPEYFYHHPIVPSSSLTSDEGAANYNRLAPSHAEPGLHLFVYGKQALDQSSYPTPKKFPARQTREASEIVARNHLLNPKQVVFACQNAKAIDEGVFHNDVISVANEFLFLTHSEAFYQQEQLLRTLKEKAQFPLMIIEISKEQLSIQEAVATYFFNSQLLSLPQSQEMLLLAPEECQHHKQAKACIDNLLADSSNPIKQVHFLDLKQSMRNGGGPACLRLRLPLNERELAAMHQGILIRNELLKDLEQWIIKNYRTELEIDDLADPQLIDESFRALDELTQLLKLGSVYSFQT